MTTVLLVASDAALGQVGEAIRFSSPTYSVFENDVTAVIRVERFGNTQTSTMVIYTVASGTNAFGAATAGADFVGASGTLVFKPDETSKSFTVTILDDSFVEGDETVSLTLRDSSGLAIATATLVIRDDEPPLGAMDPSFTPPQSTDPMNVKITTQLDGKILLGGSFHTVNGVSRKGLARLNADGSLDPSFDPGWVKNPGRVDDLIIQDDGKILVGGPAVNGFATVGIARLNPDGTVDQSFNVRLQPNYAYVGHFALQPDGKILIGGYFETVNGAARFTVARLNRDGSLDPGFNAGTGAGSGGWVGSLAVLPDGKILAGGAFNTFANTAQRSLVRLNADGSLDTTFKPPLADSAYISQIGVQPDGRILVAWNLPQTENLGITGGGILRLNEDGSLDNTLALRIAVSANRNSPVSAYEH